MATVENHDGSDGTTPHGPDGLSQPTGTTPPGRSTAAAATNGAIPPRPRIKLTFNPLAKSTVAQGNQDPIAPPVPSEPMQTPVAGPTNSPNPIPDHPDPAPANPPIPNLRLERAMANTEKKRKAEGKTAATTSKKPKTANTLAEPTGMITIKCVSPR